jgi:hypothetical protein
MNYSGKQWFLRDYSAKSNCLVIGFGSLRMFHKTRKRGFEWQNLFRYKYGDLEFKKLFVADIRNCWWHTEFDGLEGDGPPSLKTFLLNEIKKANVEKTLYVGVSMGGYGAILFGCLTNATKVMAFSPQTNISKGKRERIYRKFGPAKFYEDFIDLKNVIENTENKKTVYKIWYGNLNNNDTIAAKRISHLENIHIYPIRSSKHNVITPVLKQGLFREELESFLST